MFSDYICFWRDLRAGFHGWSPELRDPCHSSLFPEGSVCPTVSSEALPPHPQPLSFLWLLSSWPLSSPPPLSDLCWEPSGCCAKIKIFLRTCQKRHWKPRPLIQFTPLRVICKDGLAGTQMSLGSRPPYLQMKRRRRRNHNKQSLTSGDLYSPSKDSSGSIQRCLGPMRTP